MPGVGSGLDLILQEDERHQGGLCLQATIKIKAC